MFAAAKFLQRAAIRGIRREQKPAETAHGDHGAGRERGARLAQRIACHGVPLRVLQPQARAANRAGDGLRMKTAVAGIVILAPAGGAERKDGHGGADAVVRHFVDDRIPRAAARAGGERIAVAPVRGIEDFAQAIRANGEIGGDRHLRGFVSSAGINPKRLYCRGVQRKVFDLRDRIKARVRRDGSRKRGQ